MPAIDINKANKEMRAKGQQKRAGLKATAEAAEAARKVLKDATRLHNKMKVEKLVSR